MSSNETIYNSVAIQFIIVYASHTKSFAVN